MSAQFVGTGEVRRGLVDGLNDGENTIVATAGDASVTLTVINHSKNGPVFSGPHLEPWVCTTDAAGLGAPIDEDCDAPEQGHVLVPVDRWFPEAARRSDHAARRPRDHDDRAVKPCRSSSAPSKA